MRFLSVTFVAFACILSSASCERLCACTPPQPDVEGEIRGRVFAADSTPAEAALVDLVAGIDSCEPDDRVEVGPDYAEPEGDFAAWFEAYDVAGADSVCLTARAYPAAGNGTVQKPSEPVTFVIAAVAGHHVFEHDFYLTAP